jgi:hypothetical protein
VALLVLPLGVNNEDGALGTVDLGDQPRGGGVSERPQDLVGVPGVELGHLI